ncbi:hypothetical protein BUALT_Bualt05G0059700 [Buddleja alternifolia]|uniref:Zinc finger GRF-type domain-containing protein n=1 Tax=Buddleja alternifolia TaxID=168488 RepID=A0AAV6XH26_9LAMI|nr:hypothetical protein BUALT_Bualt05G0059700 [Buddleja alternifolia]
MSSMERLLTCDCPNSKPAWIQTSWTKDNPGRRFHSCKNYQGASSFFGKIHLCVKGVTPCGVPDLALSCSSTNGAGALMFTLEVAGISALEC